MATLGATSSTTEYVTASERLLLKQFFSNNSVLPGTTHKEELYTWPAADFSFLNGGTNSVSMGRSRFAVSGNPGLFGWDLGGLKTKILAIAHFRSATFNSGFFFSNTAVVAAAEPDGSYLFVTEANQNRFGVYKKAGGVYTVIASDTGLTQAGTISQSDLGIAAYYNDTTDRIVVFVRFGSEMWFPCIDFTDTTFTTMRYVGIRHSATSGVAWAMCPMAIYYDA